MEEDEMDFTARKRDVKRGRRARPPPDHQNGQPNGELPKDSDLQASIPAEGQVEQDDLPARPPRRQMGWANDSPKPSVTGDGTMSGVDAFDDERLRPDSGKKTESDSDDIPVIPDLDDVQEEELTTKIAAPPMVQVNRVATFRELDNNLLKHSQLLTLDNEIDLKLLSKCLSPESEVREEDRPWDWEHLFTEVASELQTEWDQQEGKEMEAKG
ncbi:Intraflagellar transport protein 43-like A [Holothuria leucospilota]|uniref:Intraflagellar transport protein 43-like A n=1 Tax=Holothuria leucospilota TaxID=206669 RepID=A0A9Q1CHD2_HOLLE|nr:Intraflagellar transport protein 43-like A [Holothuria leucospilota]